jgi:hypothetical protein
LFFPDVTRDALTADADADADAWLNSQVSRTVLQQMRGLVLLSWAADLTRLTRDRPFSTYAEEEEEGVQ